MIWAHFLCSSHFKVQASKGASSSFLMRINVSLCDLSRHKQYTVRVTLHTNEVIVSIIFIFREWRKCFSRATSHAALFRNRIPLWQFCAIDLSREAIVARFAEQISQPLISRSYCTLFAYLESFASTIVYKPRKLHIAYWVAVFVCDGFNQCITIKFILQCMVEFKASVLMCEIDAVRCFILSQQLTTSPIGTYISVCP